MLWQKAWLETRSRFVAGLLIVTVVAGAKVYEYTLTQRMMPLAESVVSGAGNSPLERAIRDAIATQRDFRGFMWYQGFSDIVAQMALLFAVLLGCGGLMSEAKKGSALFTLSLPVTRRQLLGVRTGRAGAAAWRHGRRRAAARASVYRGCDRDVVVGRRNVAGFPVDQKRAPHVRKHTEARSRGGTI